MRFPFLIRLLLILLPALASLAGVLATAPPALAVAVDAFVIIGQSNACGRSYANEFSDTSLASPYYHNIHYAYHERNWSTGETRGDLPLGGLKPHTSYSPNMVGAEITLGRRLAQSSDNHVMLLSYVSGGTPIANYLPESNNLYQPMLAYLAERKADMLSMGYTEVNWKGLFVVTGESDCTTEAAGLFTNRLMSVRDALQSDLHTSPLDMVFAQIRGNWVDTPAFDYSKYNSGASYINRIMGLYAQADSTLAVTVPNSDLDTRYTAGLSATDGIHYSADAYATLGDRLYDAYETFLAPMPGDASLDEVVNAIDARILAANWGETNADWVEADFNGDGVVNLADAAILAANWTHTVYRPVPGDASLDEVVNEIDAQILAANWGETDAKWVEADFNGDGLVNLADAAILAANWGYGIEQADARSSVPEPGALLMLLAGALALVVRRGR